MILDPGHPEKELKDDEEVTEGEDARSSNRQALLNVTLNYLRAMKQEHLAESLHSSKTC